MSKSQNPTLEAVLEDVEARFLYNLPESELNSSDRLFFQIEQAYWFYEDFKADKFSHLPHFANLKNFAEKIFKHCELLSNFADKFLELFSDFRQYKSCIPVFGCIILNPKMSKMALVCDYNSKSWMFPRGKVNEGESDLSCAVREVKEETGFDATAHCREDDHLVVFQDGKKVKLYIASNVPENTVFNIQTRKEISKVEFHSIDSLPKSTYGVHPFIPKLKRWISKNFKKHAKMIAAINKSPSQNALPGGGASKLGKRQSSPMAQQLRAAIDPRKASPNPIRARNAFDNRNVDTFDATGNKGWGVDAMFKANAKLTGKNYNEYDGNPQAFGASHPRYHNYNGSTGQSEAIDQSSLCAFEELSAMSLVGHKLLRGNEAADPTYDDDQHLGIAGRQISMMAGDAACLDDIIGDEIKMLPRSAYTVGQEALAAAKRRQIGENYAWTSYKLRKPFVFNAANIMSAVDQSLRHSAATVEP